MTAKYPLVTDGGRFKELPANYGLQLNASVTGQASLNVPHGTAPSSPVNGDFWSTTSGFFGRVNGSTVGPFGAGGGLADGDYGDITVSGSGTAMSIDNDAVTYAKMQNVSATSRILGRKTSGAGDPEELTLSEALDFIGSAAQGDILYRGSSAWSRLGAGSAGQVLQTNGTSANPSWVTPTGGTVVTALPGTIADCAFWYESDDLIGTSGRPINALRNRCPWINGTALAFNNIGSTVGSSTLNGLPVINFGGTTDYGYSTFGPIFAKQVTIFVVFKLNSTGAFQYILGAPNNGLHMRMSNTNVLQVEKAGVATIGSSTATFGTSTWTQVNVTYNDGTGAWAFRVARAADNSGTTAQTITSTTNTIGINPSNAFPLNAQVAALIVYARVLNSTEIGNVESYLLAKWGV